MIKEKSCGAVVYKKEEEKIYFLIEEMKAGHYSIPKGHVENNETEIETALREIKEETNLDSNDFEIICIQDDINEYAHFVTIGLLCNSYSNEIKLSNTEEHIKFNFFNINQLPDNLCEKKKKIIKSYLSKIE